MLDDGAPIEHFHGHALPGLGVLRELHLREGSLADRAADLVLTHLPDHHLRRSRTLLSSPRLSHKTLTNTISFASGGEKKNGILNKRIPIPLPLAFLFVVLNAGRKKGTRKF